MNFHQVPKIHNWKSPIHSIRYISNLELQTRGTEAIIVSLDDLERLETHVFWFSRVLGYRHEDAFNSERIGNSFVIHDSAWIESMRRSPYRTVDLSSATHFEFSYSGGNLEVVALEYPRYRKFQSAEYDPAKLHTADFAEQTRLAETVT